MNLKSTIFPVTGVMKPAGPLAEGGLLAALGPFFTKAVSGHHAADQGAHSPPHTHTQGHGAPEIPDQPLPSGWWIIPCAILGVAMWSLLIGALL